MPHALLPHPSLFSAAFWSDELQTARDVGLEVLKDLFLYFIAQFLLNRLARRLSQPVRVGDRTLLPAEREARVRTLVGITRSFGSYVLFFIFALLILRALRVDAVSVITTAGFAGVAVGFGSQKLVKDVISGFFLILEDQYGVGDYVTINAVTGRVESVGMRITKIRDGSGRLYILSNGDISQVCNLSRGAISGVIEIGIAPGADRMKAAEIADAAGIKLAEERPEMSWSQAPRFAGIGAADAAHVILRVSLSVTSPAHLEEAQVAARTAIIDQLSAAGIAAA